MPCKTPVAQDTGMRAVLYRTGTLRGWEGASGGWAPHSEAWWATSALSGLDTARGTQDTQDSTQRSHSLCAQRDMAGGASRRL